jgi:phosphate transport system permease protein
LQVLKTEAAATLRGSAGRRGSAEPAFRALTFVAGAGLLVVLGFMLFKLAAASGPVWRTHAKELVSGTRWEPSRNLFGGLPFIYGTLVTSAIALIIAVPVALAAALFVSEVTPAPTRSPLSALLDLLAAVPSVVYGLWGIFVLVPVLRPFEQMLARAFGAVPIFAGPAPGVSYFSAGVVLAIMVLPTIAAISREVFLAVPQSMREAALALGSTKWEALRLAVLRPCSRGIAGGVMLGLGRALGETIAVTMVVGNSPKIAASIFQPGYTMASVIANEFSEATGPSHLEALIAVGLLLFGVTLLLNVLARIVIRTGAYQ